jgi:hypothetical protein
MEPHLPDTKPHLPDMKTHLQELKPGLWDMERGIPILGQPRLLDMRLLVPLPHLLRPILPLLRCKP